MSLLTIVRGPDEDFEDDASRITDLLFLDGFLYSTTRFDGRIDKWNLATLEPEFERDFLGLPTTGSNPELFNVSGQLLSGGWASNSLALHQIDAIGDFGSAQSLDRGADFTALTTLNIGAETFIFGSVWGAQSLSYLVLDIAGNVTRSDTITTPSNTDIILATTFGGADLLFSASQSSNQVQSWTIASTGTPTAAQNIGAEDGLWISAPTALSTAEVDGALYLIVASAGSSSLSVAQVDSSGAMDVVHHIIDDRSTRFSQVTTLETVQHDGRSFVLAGGSDDGLTVFEVLPGGQLLARGSIANVPDATLDNPSAFAARSVLGGIEIYVASASKVGLTEVLFDTSAMGDILSGTPSNDILSGTALDDIVLDSIGSDTFTGGAGADTFVLIADGSDDQILDFELGSDLVDLSGWAGLRDSSQLFLAPTPAGIRVDYGDERLDIQSADGAPLSSADFRAFGVSITTQFDPLPQTGPSGPLTPIPDLPNRDPYNPPVQGILSEERGIERVGVATADILTGTDFSDTIWGQGGDDTITGNGGDDFLFGGSGSDKIRGGPGNDMISGGQGRSTFWQLQDAGTPNADTLLGGDGNDSLYGFAGPDWLSGGAGNDRLTGGGGRDTFVFDGGNDRVIDFQLGVDGLLLDRSLWTGSMTPGSLIDMFGTVVDGHAALDFGGDIITFEGLTTLSTIEAAIDVF